MAKRMGTAYKPEAKVPVAAEPRPKKVLREPPLTGPMLGRRASRRNCIRAAPNPSYADIGSQFENGIAKAGAESRRGDKPFSKGDATSVPE